MDSSWYQAVVPLTELLSIPINRTHTPGWDRRVEAIKDLAKYLQDPAIRMSSDPRLPSFMKEHICPAVLVQLTDLRSSIMRETSVVVGICWCLPGTLADIAVEALLPQLYKNVAKITIDVVASAAESSMSDYFHGLQVSVQAARIAMNHCREGNHKATRVAALGHMLLIMERDRVPHLRNVQSEIWALANQLTGDALAEVRETAKHICLLTAPPRPESAAALEPSQEALFYPELWSSDVATMQAGLAQLQTTVLRGEFDVTAESLARIYPILFRMLTYTDDEVRTRANSLLAHLMQEVTAKSPALMFPPLYPILLQENDHEDVVVACLEFIYMHLRNYYFTEVSQSHFATEAHTGALLKVLTEVAQHPEVDIRKAATACVQHIARRMPWLFETVSQEREEIQQLQQRIGDLAAFPRVIALQGHPNEEIRKSASALFQQYALRIPHPQIVRALLAEGVNPATTINNLAVLAASICKNCAPTLLTPQVMDFVSLHLKGEDSELRKITVRFLAQMYIDDPCVITAFTRFSMAQLKIIEIWVERMTNDYTLDLIGEVAKVKDKS